MSIAEDYLKRQLSSDEFRHALDISRAARALKSLSRRFDSIEQYVMSV